MDQKINHHRKLIRLGTYDYSQASYYFVTVVTHKRINILGSVEDGFVSLNSIGTLAEDLWNEIPLHFPNITIDHHIIMPNLLHGIIIINNDVGARHASPLQIQSKMNSHTLGNIIGSFKSAVTKLVHDLGLLSQEKIWQRGCFEHIIRDEQEHEKIYEYIEANPINGSLDEENPERSK